MDEFGIFLVLLIIGCVLAGPVALIISIVALGRIKELKRLTQNQILFSAEPKAQPKQPEIIPKPIVPLSPPPQQSEPPAPIPPVTPAKKPAEVSIPKLEVVESKAKVSLEQRIGTKWVLIAGVMALIFGVGFFLKYAYDNNLVGPLGRVVIAAVAGLISLFVGEVTRKRGYGIVAKGITALGFAILYAAVFSAYRFYNLIDSVPAFILAIVVTVTAMLYAIALDEVIIAFLALLGGFLTPVILSTGENLPMPLFGYVLVLGLGVMLCNQYRRWRVINLLCFVGTFGLYIGWFEKFFRSSMVSSSRPPEQMAIAIGWLAIFFLIYLAVPMLYGLAKSAKANKEDIMLVLADAIIAFYYLWTILFDRYRTELAFACLGMCAAYLVMMVLTGKRCREDINCHLALLTIGLFFLTIAIPLYLKMYAISIAWALEAVVLTVIGKSYKSRWTQFGGFIALLLSLGHLLYQLPIHTAAFTFVLNPAFGTWCLVAAATFALHIFYRKDKELNSNISSYISNSSYFLGLFLLFIASAMEWYYNCRYNTASYEIARFYKGLILLLPAFWLLLLIRPISPKGMIVEILAAMVAAAGSVFVLVAFTEIYHEQFIVFLNANFGIAAIFVLALFAAAVLLWQTGSSETRKHLAYFFSFAAVAILWVLLTEQIYLYWYCRSKYGQHLEDWRFLANMYISVMWAVYAAVLLVIGFWRNIKLLRYVALGLFALLLLKVFIVDTSRIESVYRITAFVATGLSLVGTSYLYQFLRKKGFFDKILSE